MPRKAIAQRFDFPAGAPREAVLRTAYLLLPLASVALGEQAGRPFLELHLRPGVDAADAAREAAAVFAGQLVRVAVTDAAAGVRVELTRRMLALAGRAAARPEAASGLPPDQAARVAALLAEKGAWEDDPESIKTPWSELRRGR